MLLKIGIPELNEDLSMELFLKMFKWYWENFGLELKIDKCEELLIEYGFVLDWVYHNNKEFGCDLIHFFITVKDEEIIKTKLDDVSYYEFEFVNVFCASDDPDDELLIQIIKNEVSRN